MPGLITTPPSSSSVLFRFHNLTLHAPSAQASLLRQILLDNSSCQYLRQLPGSSDLLRELSRQKRHRRDDAVDDGTAADADAAGVDDDLALLAAFRKFVPLVTHADIRPFIDRIVDGGRQASEGILTAAPVEGLCLSSGTTDAKPKYLLYHEGLKAGTIEVGTVAAAFRQRDFPPEAGGRILELLFCGQLSTTPGGLKAGTASTHMIRSGAYARRQSSALGLLPCTPQDLTLLATDSRQAMYCHLLAGLLHADQVVVLSAPFAFTVVEAIRSLQTLWPTLCHDIRHATLDSRMVSDAALRRAVETQLCHVVPKPDLADRLAASFRSLRASTWRGLVPTIFPHCKYILSILTGAMEPYVGTLSHYADHVPLIAADYAATEGWIGVNISPSSPPSAVSFTIHPSLAFWEFIPLYRRCASHPAAAAYEEGTPVAVADVCVGQEYEIVMTTAWGLYRYRLGDVVRVTGFYNAAPQVQYVCRRNVLLSINIDKVTEKDVKVAMEAAKATAEGVDLEVVDYTSYAERDGGLEGGKGHYVVFWEVEWGRKTEAEIEMSGSVLGECAAAMDRALCAEMGYATSRKLGSIGALELCVVRAGSFLKLLDNYLARSTAAITQYKTPRCLSSADSVALMRSCTVATFLSSATF